MTPNEKKGKRAALAKIHKKERRRKFLKRLFHRKITYAAVFFVLSFIVCAAFARAIAPYDPYAADYLHTLAAPDSLHLLGTDLHGRDVLTRIIYGARVSLIVGVFTTVLATAAGSFIGMCAGYMGGRVDNLIMRFVEVFRSIPGTVLALALTATFGGGIVKLSCILGFSNMFSFIRMMRAQVLPVKEQDYITAAKLQGNKTLRLMMHHLMPNCISPIIVLMTQTFGHTILSEAGLSFLGLGIAPPTATWGGMINDGRMYLMQNPVFAIAPGIAVALLVVSLNIFGDSLRDALDPRLRSVS